MKTRFVLSSIFLISAILIGANTVAAQTEQQMQRAQSWQKALDSIDNASGAGDLIPVLCFFIPTQCNQVERISARLTVKYRRTAMRSWRARGINIPSKCYNLTIDGAQLERIWVAVGHFKAQLKAKYYNSAHDLLGYGFLPWSDLECQTAARKEILRVRGLEI